MDVARRLETWVTHQIIRVGSKGALAPGELLYHSNVPRIGQVRNFV